MVSTIQYSIGETISIFHELGYKTRPRADLTTNICAFHPSYRLDNDQISWHAQRDATQFMTEFERASFSIYKRLLYVPNSQFITLDDDLLGTRSKDNQVKCLSARKADREGHSADVIADGIFRITLDARI